MNNPAVKYLINNHFLAALIVIALFWLIFQLSSILILIFISYIIMAALSPFSDFLIKKRAPRILSVLIPYAIAIAILILLIFPLFPFFTSQIQLLFGNFPKYINQAAKIFNLQVDSTSIQNAFESDLNTIGANALSVTGKIFGGFFSLITVLVISFYLMLERQMLKEKLIVLLPKKYENKGKETLSLIEKKLGLWLRGQIVLSFTIGFGTWIGLTALNVPFALPLGFLAGILEIIPTLGPIIAAVPAIIVALTISPGLAATVVVFYILLQMLENHILVPKIMEKAVGLNPIVIILGVLIGGKFLGILGALLAVPFIAMVIILAKSLKPTNS